ncbi:MAG: hypothetical protein AAGB11_15985, partial [Pseudomonadota bacterium]
SLDLGSGADTVEGFGAVRIDGGAGRDSLAFDFSATAFQDGGGEIVEAALFDFEITFQGETLAVRNVEDFIFAGETVAAADLLAQFADAIA